MDDSNSSSIAKYNVKNNMKNSLSHSDGNDAKDESIGESLLSKTNKNVINGILNSSVGIHKPLSIKNDDDIMLQNKKVKRDESGKPKEASEMSDFAKAIEMVRENGLKRVAFELPELFIKHYEGFSAYKNIIAQESRKEPPFVTWLTGNDRKAKWNYVLEHEEMNDIFISNLDSYPFKSYNGEVVAVIPIECRLDYKFRDDDFYGKSIVIMQSGGMEKLLPVLNPSYQSDIFSHIRIPWTPKRIYILCDQHPDEFIPREDLIQPNYRRSSQYIDNETQRKRDLFEKMKTDVELVKKFVHSLLEFNKNQA